MPRVAYSKEFKEAQMAIAIKYNLLKTTFAKPLIVSTETALEICPGSILVQSNLRTKESDTLRVYWTGLRIAVVRPDTYTNYKNSRDRAKITPTPEVAAPLSLSDKVNSFILNPDAPEYVPLTKVRRVIRLKKNTQ